ncbi:MULTISPECIES: ImmA/IrrE family metallo-endopeptidase [Clostridia]|uniref:ImmA/IrrE family metallo-endopeptidase n=1 Tax=Clostridia TaxID=186801 RepID=UPI0013145A9E|nr:MULTISPECIES: ImmA/IrrE family metallo-endopeptidase [Clostridia]
MFFTRTEDYIQRFLLQQNIHKPNDLTIKNIASSLNIPVYYWEYSSECVYLNERCLIFLNSNRSEQEQWQEFGHEIAHFLWHTGRQEFLPSTFIELQEWQANYFSYHLCIPTFMLQRIKTKITPKYVMNLFNVEYDFACKRLEMYRNKWLASI